NISLAVGELLNTNINRSLDAFLQNPEAERQEFLNSRGEEVDNNKRMVQLNLVRDNSSAVGVINWFGVHTTIVGSETTLVSGDHKSYASQGFERIMRSDYLADAQQDSFVAAFAQKDEGDASPNIFILERPHPDPTRGGGEDVYESTAIAGTKQLAKALDLFNSGKPLTGPIDYRLFHVQMDQVTVDDPVVLASLQHPPELDAEEKRTCVGALGPAFGAGAEDGPGYTKEGISCNDDPDVVQAASDDIMTALSGLIPPELASTAVLCNLDQLPAIDLACHAEKPVLLVLGPPQNAEPSVLPFQLFRMGNLAVLGIPWEVTTMSARRIQKLLFPILAPDGIDTIVIAGLVNDFVHYLTTREEYSIQHYEGGSNMFGPWTLAAVQQESRRLAQSLVNGNPAPEGPAYIEGTPRQQRTPYIPSDTPGLGPSFGDVVTDVPETAAPGDTVRAEFQSGHPRNDLRIQSSYVYVDKQNSAGEWEVVFTDNDPELFFAWHPLVPSPLPIEVPQVGPSTAEAIWHIPANTPPGTYRLRHAGAAQTTPLLPLEQFEGVSSPFTVAGPVANCP
ncbi:MAG: neutral/alkaline non-lysosomal ceramidase N-terminal domain-containing protein, partial [Salinisphaeraceae bacterium]|nr:neutral/alkaline non-lysosomal ceramidase N-terminal domain-containing protein [Salinisphaeraceae bacterium]